MSARSSLKNRKESLFKWIPSYVKKYKRRLYMYDRLITVHVNHKKRKPLGTPGKNCFFAIPKIHRTNENAERVHSIAK